MSKPLKLVGAVELRVQADLQQGDRDTGEDGMALTGVLSEKESTEGHGNGSCRRACFARGRGRAAGCAHMGGKSAVHTV